MTRFISRRILKAYCVKHELIDHPPSMASLSDGVKMMNAMRKWDWLKAFEPKPDEGFMWSQDPTVLEFGKQDTFYSLSARNTGWTLHNLQMLVREEAELKAGIKD